MDETRELTVRLTLTDEEWKKLEQYAANDGKSFQEYIDWYAGIGMQVALREGYVYDAFKEMGDTKEAVAAFFVSSSHCAALVGPSL